eukprot:330904_1
MGSMPSSKESHYVDDNIKMIERMFKVHVGIDFGTDGCALAFAHNGKVTVYDKWNTKKRKRSVKVKTQLLLNDKDEVVAFGDNANIIYSNLSGKEKTEWKFFDKFKMSLYEPRGLPKKHDYEEISVKASGSTATHKAKGGISAIASMLPFAGCAMNHAQDDADDIKRDQAQYAATNTPYIKAMNDKRCSPDLIFTEVFNRLKVIAMEYIKGYIDNNINSDDIQWIVTVPAIWTENAKDKMKTWATEALLAQRYDHKIKDQILIVYEPDCAALAIFEEWKPKQPNPMNDHEVKQGVSDKTNDNTDTIAPELMFMLGIVDGLIHNAVTSHGSKQLAKVREQESNQFKIGDKYVLIDIGGGTLDVVCHQIVGIHAVQEIHYATGGKSGGSCVDRQYIQLFRDIFSKEMITEFKQSCPNIYLEIIDNFRDAKAKFYRKGPKALHSVDLPYEFVQYLTDKLADDDCDMDTKIAMFLVNADQYFKHECGNDEEKKESGVYTITIDEDTLTMSIAIWKYLFDSVINKIESHVCGLLKDVKALEGCRYLCLVGGFASSKYLQARMENAFGIKSKFNLIVKVATKPALSVVKGAAYFGIKPYFMQARILKYTYGLRVNWKMPKAKKMGVSDSYMSNEDNIMIDSDGIRCVKGCFQVIAQKLQRVSVKDVITRTTYANAALTAIPILFSDLQQPNMAAEGQILATLVMNTYPDEELIIEFHFYGTMFEVCAYPTLNKAAKQTVDIQYVNMMTY